MGGSTDTGRERPSRVGDGGGRTADGGGSWAVGSDGGESRGVGPPGRRHPQEQEEAARRQSGTGAAPRRGSGGRSTVGPSAGSGPWLRPRSAIGSVAPGPRLGPDVCSRSIAARRATASSTFGEGPRPGRPFAVRAVRLPAQLFPLYLGVGSTSYFLLEAPSSPLLGNTQAPRKKAREFTLRKYKESSRKDTRRCSPGESEVRPNVS